MMHEEDERPPKENLMLIILALLTTDEIFTCVSLEKAGLVVGPLCPSISPSAREKFRGTKFV